MSGWTRFDAMSCDVCSAPCLVYMSDPHAMSSLPCACMCAHARARVHMWYMQRLHACTCMHTHGKLHTCVHVHGKFVIMRVCVLALEGICAFLSGVSELGITSLLALVCLHGH